MKLIIAILLSLFTIADVAAQSLRDAETAFNTGDYTTAYDIYTTLAGRNRRDYNLKYRAARCLLAMHRYDEAIPLLEQAAARNVRNAYYYLYEAHYATYRFDRAHEAISTYLDVADLTDEGRAIALELQSKAARGVRMMESVADVVITDSLRLHKSRLLDAYSLSATLGSISYSHNDTTLQTVGYITGRGDKRIVASRRDSTTALAVAYRLLDGWGEASWLSDNVNTAADENYPFELSDGITLYFASRGHESLGGYDIFMTRFNSATDDYTRSLNIGMPFNSPANDYMMVYDDLQHKGWFATDRRQHPDSVMVYSFLPDADRRTILTDDTDARRRAAMLLTYRTSEATAADSRHDDRRLGERGSIDFLVDDGVVYTSVEQFRSSAARELYTKWQDTVRRHGTSSRLLEGKRREYSVSDDEADREALRGEITSLEQDIIALEYEMDDMVREIRRLELQTIRK